jgi:hypothetical protein
MFEESITENEERALRKITHYRTLLTSFFKKDFFISSIKEIVEESNFFDFFDNRSKKFVSIHQPEFRLKMKNEKKAISLYGSPALDTDDKLTEWKILVLSEEVINPFLTVLSKEIEKIDDPKIKESREEIFKLMPEMTDLDSFVLTALFKVLIENSGRKLITLNFLI